MDLEEEEIPQSPEWHLKNYTLISIKDILHRDTHKQYTQYHIKFI